MAQFLDRIERREIHHHGPRHHRAVIRCRIDRHVGKEQTDPLSLGDPARLQTGREALRIAIDLGIAVTTPHEIDQRRIRRALDSSAQHVGHRQGRQIHIPRVGMRVILSVIDSHVSNMARRRARGKRNPPDRQAAGISRRLRRLRRSPRRPCAPGARLQPRLPEPLRPPPWLRPRAPA